jgi:Nuclease-related domain
MSLAGGSARQEHQRRRARELAVMRQLPVALALVLGTTLLVFIVVTVAGNAFFHPVVPKGQESTAGSLAESHVAVWIAACLAALCAGGAVARVAWGRGQTTEARVRGAESEERTARLLAPLEHEGWIAGHDLRVPGSRTNIDHVMLGPPGVFVIDSKNWSGTVEVTADTVLHSGRNRERELAALLWEASAVDQALREGLAVAGIQAVAVMCVQGARVTRPRGRSDPRYGVQVLGAGQLVAWLRAQPLRLKPDEVAGLAELCQQRLARPPAA